MSRADRDDLGQDIALEVLIRLKGFDPNRASFATFVELVASHAAQRLGERAGRARRSPQTVPLSLESVGMDLSEPGDRRWVQDQRLALQAMVEKIPTVLSVLMAVAQGTAGAVLPPASRSTLWRRRRDLRCLLLLHGVDRPP